MQQKSLLHEQRKLIHFESHKMTFNQMIILLNNMIIKSKTCVWWLNQQQDLSVQDVDDKSSASYACQKSWTMSSTLTKQ